MCMYVHTCWPVFFLLHLLELQTYIFYFIKSNSAHIDMLTCNTSPTPCQTVCPTQNLCFQHGHTMWSVTPQTQHAMLRCEALQAMSHCKVLQDPNHMVHPGYMSGYGPGEVCASMITGRLLHFSDVQYRPLHFASYSPRILCSQLRDRNYKE